jgi:hypothetical protein
MTKREYLNLCLRQPAWWLSASAANPSPSMRPIHVALIKIALRRMGAL